MRLYLYQKQKLKIIMKKGKTNPYHHNSQGQAPHRNLLSLSHTAMNQSGNESERQSKKQKLQIQNPSRARSRTYHRTKTSCASGGSSYGTRTIAMMMNSRTSPPSPGKVYFAIEENHNARMTAEAQTDEKPKTGRWFCLQPYIPPPIYCRICKKSNDHMTKQCLRFDSSTAVRDVRCPFCLREDHVVTICPYRYYVPKGEKVGPGGKLVCICCQKEGGHPGEEWVGKAVGNYCRICSSTYDHRTEDCPVKKGREIVGGKFQSAMVDS